jgi:hypothetical protein
MTMNIKLMAMRIEHTNSKVKFSIRLSGYNGRIKQPLQNSFNKLNILLFYVNSRQIKIIQ